MASINKMQRNDERFEAYMKMAIDRMVVIDTIIQKYSGRKIPSRDLERMRIDVSSLNDSLSANASRVFSIGHSDQSRMEYCLAKIREYQDFIFFQSLSNVSIGASGESVEEDLRDISHINKIHKKQK